MYQNRLEPSGGIYYPNFVTCFVVLYLNTSHTKVYFNEFVANVLRYNMGMVIFDL
jgi:hypothetical protein